MTRGTFIRLIRSTAFISVRPVLLLTRFLCVSFFATGGHIAGSEMNYRSLGNRTYEITYQIYTDQTGGCPGSLTPIEARSTNCGSYINGLLSLQTPQGERIGPGCTSSNTPIFFTKWTYTGTIQLPFDCDDWKLNTNECCRGASINSIQSPEQSAIYSEVCINTTLGNNTSMQLPSNPSFIVWEGQINKKRVPSTGTGFDSIRIETARPRISISSDVSYLAGYSENNPIRSVQPISMDGTTGEFEVQPLQSETGVIAYKANGYINGRLVASISREHRIVSLAPTNHLPELSGVDGSAHYTINECAGNPFDHFFILNDMDPGANPTVTEIIGLPGAQFTIMNGRLQLNWPGSSSILTDTTVHFSVRVSDQQCPVAAEQVFGFEIRIRRNIFSQQITATLTDATCANGSDGSIHLNFPANSSPTILWQDGSNSLQRTNVAPGMYHAVITDGNTGCRTVVDYGLGFEHLPPAIFLGADQVVCEGTSMLLDAGSGFVSYTWNNGSSGNSLAISQSGYYHVTVTDQYGCSGSAGTNIQFQTCTGIDAPSSDSGFEIYPNPAADQIRFNPRAGAEYGWRIFDTAGRLQASNSEPVHGETTIGLEHLPAGIYHFQWSDIDGNHITRFIKR